MLRIMDIMNLVFGVIYGGLTYLGLQKILNFKLNNSCAITTGIVIFLIGYLFALFTSDIWFIIFPVIILLALALKVREVVIKN